MYFIYKKVIGIKNTLNQIKNSSEIHSTTFFLIVFQIHVFKKIYLNTFFGNATED